MSAVLEAAAARADPVEAPDVAIVGAGPAGLAAAALLAERGASVVVLERGDEPGGIPRHCGHSPFGMREFGRILSGRRYAARLAEAAVKAGAMIRLRHSVVGLEAGPQLTVATPEGVRAMAPKRALLATGIREATRAARLVGGVRPQGVMNTGALQDTVYLRGLKPFRRPLIVGTELVSMSAILTCRHIGAKPVAVIEAGGGPTVRAPFAWLPRVLRIPVHYGAGIVEIFGGAQVEAATVRLADGSVVRIACDGVVFTGGFTPEASLARGAGIAIDPGGGGPVVDGQGHTAMPGVYAAGNTLRGVETAGWCWAEGRAVARAILAGLDGEPAAEEGALRVEAGENVRLVVPQRLSRGGPGALPKLQIRLAKPVRGELRVEAAGRTIWSRRIRSGPERRVAVPVAELRLPPGVDAVRVLVHEAGG